MVASATRCALCTLLSIGLANLSGSQSAVAQEAELKAAQEAFTAYCDAAATGHSQASELLAVATEHLETGIGKLVAGYTKEDLDVRVVRIGDMKPEQEFLLVGPPNRRPTASELVLCQVYHNLIDAYADSKQTVKALDSFESELLKHGKLGRVPLLYAQYYCCWTYQANAAKQLYSRDLKKTLSTLSRVAIVCERPVRQLDKYAFENLFLVAFHLTRLAMFHERASFGSKAKSKRYSEQASKFLRYILEHRGMQPIGALSDRAVQKIQVLLREQQQRINELQPNAK